MLNHLAPVHSSEKFTFSKNVFVCEASDLGLNGRLYTDKIYTDAVDEGFFIQSYRTGMYEAFRLARLERDGDGDLLVEIYEACDPVLRNRGIEVHILND